MHPRNQLVVSLTALAVGSLVLLGAGGSPTVEAAVEAGPVPVAATVLGAPPPADVDGLGGRVVLPPRAALEAAAPVPVARTGDGRLVATGTSTDPVAAGGPRVTWSLEVEEATGLDVGEVLAVAEAALHDRRSWAADHELVRVADPGAARIRVLVATPATVDRLCAVAGLDTVGQLSCWNGRYAALNLDRWLLGSSAVTDLDLYRTYLVNHEVGHGLGEGHVDCPGAGARAPVMQQQTKGLAGCVANPWPYPDA